MLCHLVPNSTSRSSSNSSGGSSSEGTAAGLIRMSTWEEGHSVDAQLLKDGICVSTADY